MWLLIGMVVFATLAAIFLLCLCCSFKSLKLAIAVIEVSSDFLNQTKRLILIPILYFFLTVACIVLWLGGLFCVLSLNDFKPSETIP